ncbi:MAG: hypothetical protein ABJL11_00740 [Parasphingorhabdus sp.]
MMERTNTILVDEKQRQAEIITDLERVLVALDQIKMAVPAIKVAEAVDALKSAKPSCRSI